VGGEDRSETSAGTFAEAAAFGEIVVMATCGPDTEAAIGAEPKMFRGTKW